MKRYKENITSYLFLLPWLVIFITFTIYPFIYGIAISFTKFDFASMEFNGLDNYKAAFTNEIFWKAMRNTFIYSVFLIPLNICGSLFIANAIFKRNKHFQTLVKGAFYFPVLINQVATVLVWKWIFNPSYGIISSVLNAFGFKSVDWLGKPELAYIVIILMVISLSIAQPIILFSAAMNGVPSSYFEAASIDGATSRQIFVKITVPLLKPTTLFVLVTTTIGILQIFVVPYLLTGGGPYHSTTSLLLLLYQSAFILGKYGYAAAIGMIIFIITAVVASVQFKLTVSDDIQY